MPPSYAFFPTTDAGRAGWMARRQHDDALFVVQPIDDPAVAALLLDDPNSTSAASARHLLHHRHLVSIVDIVAFRGTDSNSDSSRAVLWDHCEGGTLADVLKRRVYDEDTLQHLPESLCWHVALAVLQALAWLHDGEDTTTTATAASSSSSSSSSLPQSWSPARRDWFPVMHRAVTPHCILFQLPKNAGNHSYGTCKLGDFRQCHVTGHMDDSVEMHSMLQPPPGQISITAPSPWSRQCNLVGAGYHALSRGIDIACLGNVLHEMMLGQKWITEDQLDDIGQLAMRVAMLDTHRKEFDEWEQQHKQNDGGDVDVEDNNSTPYSRELKQLLWTLLGHFNNRTVFAGPGAAGELYRKARRGYDQWLSELI